jgi:hypothetical protein
MTISRDGGNDRHHATALVVHDHHFILDQEMQRLRALLDLLCACVGSAPRRGNLCGMERLLTTAGRRGAGNTAFRNLPRAAAFCDGMRNLRAILVAVPAMLATGLVWARDDGRYANSPLKPWFDSLSSGRGLCCSNADGVVVSDPDWDSKDGHYRVRLDGEWIDVPDDAVIKVPNRAGRTMVWPLKGSLGTSIRCFLPGSMS